MNILQAIILGVIQGITEWLPISSSGHLVILQSLFNLEVPLEFDILLHFASLLVIVTIFWKDIFLILKDVLHLDFKSEHGRLGFFIFFATLPIVITGYFFYDFVESLFSNLFAVGIALIITGGILFLSKLKSQNNILTTKNTFIIGIAQIFALVPGISRSGITISTGLIQGIDREKAARFSFLLAVPAIFGATVLELVNGIDINIPIITIVIGMISSYIIGYLSLKLLLKIIKERKFHVFAYYCWILGIVVLFL